MDAIVDDLRPEVVIPAMEQNFVQWWRGFARAPQADFHDEPEISWLHSSIPLAEYNGVVRTQMHAERSSYDVEALITATVRSCTLPDVGMSWCVTPSTQPADLGEMLQQRGFFLLGMAPGMAVDLAVECPGILSPARPNLEIVRVSDASLLQDWVDVAVASYGESEAVRQARYAVHEALGWKPDSPLQRYVALLDDAPVATSAIFLGGGVAGIYEVGTVPAHRRQGVGTAITLAAMDASAKYGYRIGVLQASPMGEPLYRRLGFRQFCQYHFYVRR